MHISTHIHPSTYIPTHSCIHPHASIHIFIGPIHPSIHLAHGSIGEESIKQYFRNTSIDHPIMGQGVLLIGWTCLAIGALFLNNLSYLAFGHVGSLQKDRHNSDIMYEAEDNTTAAYRKLKQQQQQDTTTIDTTTEKPETSTATGIIELGHIYSSPNTISGNHE